MFTCVFYSFLCSLNAYESDQKNNARFIWFRIENNLRNILYSTFNMAVIVIYSQTVSILVTAISKVEHVLFVNCKF